MGGCLSQDGDIADQGGGNRSTSRRSRHGVSSQPAIGKNQPLKHELPKWKSEIPLTMGQLMSKRDEFWDTAPAFDGRKEIWDALKAAASACESKDFELAQAIISGVNVTIPYGCLTDCYDELGNRYQLPVYVLSRPANLQKDDSSDNLSADGPDADPGDEVIIKLRLSDGKDLKLTVRSRHTVGKIKRILAKAENISSEQRWFYGGKVLQDKLRIEETKIPKGHLIQVILPYREPEPEQQPVGENSKNTNSSTPTPVSS